MGKRTDDTDDLSTDDPESRDRRRLIKEVSRGVNAVERVEFQIKRLYTLILVWFVLLPLAAVAYVVMFGQR